MVSNVDSSGEGWPWVDELPQVCLPPNKDGVYYEGHNLPTVAHHCQTFRIGDFMFTKRLVWLICNLHFA
ncbi:hypothetical protein EON63_07090 [archaeon]|nr:MAG: hypothetical protein EON63_07090 [archaeon]